MKNVHAWMKWENKNIRKRVVGHVRVKVLSALRNQIIIIKNY